MSQPRQIPPYSTSPSKPSLRRVSGSQNPSQRSLLPSPHFEDKPAGLSRTHQSPRPIESPYEENLDARVEDTIDPPTYPQFQPFFTLIEDRITNEHHHPTVQYIFADDDADIITEAAVRSLEQNDGLSYSSQAVTSQTRSEEQQATQAQGDQSYIAPSRLPPPTPGVKEHYILLDIHPVYSSLNPSPNTNLPSSQLPSPQNVGVEQATGLGITGPSHQQQQRGGATYPASYEVTYAQSFSSEWQVMRTNISSAPTWGGEASDEDGEGLLMLKIEGRGNGHSSNIHVPVSGVGGPGMREREVEKGEGREKDRESVEEMIERFQKRLEDIRAIMATAPQPMRFETEYEEQD